jgi:hypothetical protein
MRCAFSLPNCPLSCMLSMAMSSFGRHAKGLQAMEQFFVFQDTPMGPEEDDGPGD